MPDPEGSARQPPAAPPELIDSMRPWPGLDRLGLLQAIGGLLLGLIGLLPHGLGQRVINNARSEDWPDASKVYAASRFQISQCFLRQPIQCAGFHVVLQVLIPVRRIKALEPSAEPGTACGIQLLQSGLNGLEACHRVTLVGLPGHARWLGDTARPARPIGLAEAMGLLGRGRWDTRPNWWHLRDGDRQCPPQLCPRPCDSVPAHAQS